MRRENKYWLMANVIHGADFNFWVFSSEWTIYLDSLKDTLNEGDIIYLANAVTGVYGWGYLVEKSEAKPNEQLRIKISRGAIKTSLIDSSQIRQIADLADLLLFSEGKFTFLTNKQVKILNSLLPHGVSKPPIPRNQQFILNQTVETDEWLSIEYKEVGINSISNEAYEFAIAYLNQDGGSIYFGIRNSNNGVIGLNATHIQRDEIQKKIENKLSLINPPIYPVTNYSMEFHQVIDDAGNEIPNLFIFELEVKPSSLKNYTSAGGKNYLKTFSGRKKLE